MTCGFSEATDCLGTLDLRRSEAGGLPRGGAGPRYRDRYVSGAVGALWIGLVYDEPQHYASLRSAAVSYAAQPLCSAALASLVDKSSNQGAGSCLLVKSGAFTQATVEDSDAYRQSRLERSTAKRLATFPDTKSRMTPCSGDQTPMPPFPGAEMVVTRAEQAP